MLLLEQIKGPFKKDERVIFNKGFIYHIGIQIPFSSSSRNRTEYFEENDIPIDVNSNFEKVSNNFYTALNPDDIEINGIKLKIGELNILEYDFLEDGFGSDKGNKIESIEIKPKRNLPEETIIDIIYEKKGE